MKPRLLLLKKTILGCHIVPIHWRHTPKSIPPASSLPTELKKKKKILRQPDTRAGFLIPNTRLELRSNTPERHLARTTSPHLARDPGVLTAARLLEYTTSFMSAPPQLPSPQDPPELSPPNPAGLTWSESGKRRFALHGGRKGLPKSPTAAPGGSQPGPSCRRP